MARKTIPFRLNDFSGSLNTYNSNSKLKDNESTVRENCWSRERGTLQMRNGFSHHTSSSIANFPITGLYRYYKISGGGSKEMLAVCGTKIYTIDDSDGSAVAIKTIMASTPYTEADLVQTTTLDTYFTTFDNQCIIANGIDVIKTYDGSHVSDLGGSPPVGKYLASFAERIFTSGYSTYASRIYWSNRGDETVWSANDFWDIGYDDGDEVMQIYPHMDNLIVFKRNSIHIMRYVGDDFLFDAQQSSSPVGCIAPKTVVPVGRYLFFLSNDGVYAFNGVDSDKVSQPVTSYMEDINPAYMHQACAVMQDDHYWLFYTSGSSTYNDACLVLNVSKLTKSSVANLGGMAWSKFTNHYIRSVCVWDSNADDEEFYGGSSLTNAASPTSSGMIYRLNNGETDAYGLINMTYETKQFDFDAPELVKRFRKMFIWAYASGDYDLKIAYNIDGRGWSSYKIMDLNAGLAWLWGDTTSTGVTWGDTAFIWGSPQQTFKKISSSGRGKRCKFRFTYTAATQFKMYEFALYRKDKKVR